MIRPDHLERRDLEVEAREVGGVGRIWWIKRVTELVEAGHAEEGDLEVEGPVVAVLEG